MEKIKKYLQWLTDPSHICNMFGHKIKWYIISRVGVPCARCGQRVHWTHDNVKQY